MTILALYTMLNAVSLDRMEYFFDSDPGQGNGTVLFSRSSVEIDTTISTSSLSSGFHILFARARNDAGDWGMPQRKTFYKVPTETVPPDSAFTVAGVEYFFDSDPGQGNGIQLPVRNSLELDSQMNTSTLNPGFHRLYVRAMNSSGDWGMPQRSTFYKPLPPSPVLLPSPITHLEYFFDQDPGEGEGTVIELTPGTEVSYAFQVDAGGLEHGNHQLFARVKNSQGVWGLPTPVTFSDGIPAHVVITSDGSLLTISWEDLFTIDTYKVYSSPEYYTGFTEDTTGVFGTSSWTAPAVDPKKFFRVTSIYDLSK